MCRYAMSSYKPHYACFECRKAFKRRLMWDIQRADERVEAKCPQCGTLMADMGLDFAAPKKDNIKQWEHIRTLYAVGITFQSCGCTGPGYIPNTKERLIEYFQELINQYNQQLAFWRQRVEPVTDKEIQRENSKKWHYIGHVPQGVRPKKGPVLNEDAKKYWMDKIRQMELKLSELK
jgi:hypothetical protein